MNFIQAVRTCLRKSLDFSGRAGRAEFWCFFLFRLVVLYGVVGLWTLWMKASPSQAPESLETVFAIVYGLLLLPYLAVGARRLRDTGRSAWWLLLWPTGIGNLVLLSFWSDPTPPEGGLAPHMQALKDDS